MSHHQPPLMSAKKSKSQMQSKNQSLLICFFISCWPACPFLLFREGTLLPPCLALGWYQQTEISHLRDGSWSFHRVRRCSTDTVWDGRRKLPYASYIIGDIPHNCLKELRKFHISDDLIKLLLLYSQGHLLSRAINSTSLQIQAALT